MNDTLEQSLSLMVLGMGTVFVFLGLLVLAVLIMSHLLAIPESASPDLGETADSATAGAENPELISAIIAAVHRHRSEKS